MHDDLIIPLGSAHPSETCPECDDVLLLATNGRYGAYYRCINYPDCPGSSAAHADGTPMGTAEKQEVKRKRQFAHDIFKVCLLQSGLPREKLETRMLLTVGTSHFSRMNERQLVIAVREIQKKIKE